MIKSGFVSIVGRPNVGKSTLLNSILGEKVAITSAKPQTTRNRIRGIYTRQDEKDTLQMVFIDTPGIHKGKNKLGKAMTDMALSSFGDADVLLFLVDGRPDAGPGDMAILDSVKSANAVKFLVINKIDQMSPQDFKYTYDYYESLGIFHKVCGISALERVHVDSLLKDIEAHLKEGYMFYPVDMHTDHPEKFIAAEIIREKALHFLDEEVPHGVAVEIESFKEKKDIVIIDAVIYCEKKSHKGIIIGKEGRKLKGIGKSARMDIEQMLGVKVLLNLWVKVKENWRDSDFMLKNLGYGDK